jgi:hypothetical protein
MIFLKKQLIIAGIIAIGAFWAGWQVKGAFVAKRDLAIIEAKNEFIQAYREGEPQLIDGNWTQVWNVTDKAQEDVDTINEQLRANAYREESDPLFFKYQRGEIEKQVWLEYKYIIILG